MSAAPAPAPASASFLEAFFSLSGKTALVTGGTRGIGQAIAVALAQAGADVVLLQRDPTNDSAAARIRALGRKATVVACDLTDAARVKAVVREVVEAGHVLDVLVNCGGIQRRHPAEVFPDSDWDEVLQVNLTSCFTLARDVGKHMLEVRAKPGEENRARGKIINIASLVSFQGGLTVPAYAAAKHGILGMTKALSNDWAGKGINVNAIAPGYIDTEMNSALIANPTRSRQIFERMPIGKWGKPEDMVGAAVFLASPASDYVCGECITVDGGWMAR